MVLELMRFLLRKTADGPFRSRLSFCCAKRHSAWSTAIADNSGFLFSLIRQSRMLVLTYWGERRPYSDRAGTASTEV